MSYIGQNLNVANSTPRASETQVGLTPYATTVETFFGANKALQVSTDGIIWRSVCWSSDTVKRSINAIIPSGHYYRVQTGYSSGKWMELR